MEESKSSSGLTFGDTLRSVLANIKSDQAKVMTFEGRANRSEYWATYLLTGLPLGIVSSLLYVIAYSTCGHSDTSVKISYYLASLSVAFLALSYLVLVPILVRRAHDLALPGWIGGAVYASQVVPFVGPYLPGLAVIALGCIPSRSSTEGVNSNEKQAKYVIAIWAMAILGVGFVATRIGCSYVQVVFKKALMSAFGG